MKNALLVIILFAFFSCKKFDANRITKVATKDLVFIDSKVKAVGAIVDISDKGIQDHGFCWAYNSIPTINDWKASLQTAAITGDFNCNLSNLEYGKTIYARAFAQSGGQIVYGDVVSFNTDQANISIGIGVPKIVNSGKITVEGSILNLGSIIAKEYGHCYSTNPNPTIANSKSRKFDLNKDTTFISDLFGLTLNTIYYLRTYAMLSETNVVYSNAQTVKIPILQLTTDTFSISNATTSNLKGSIVDLGADPITEYGFVWSTTNPFPNYGDNKLVNPASPKLGAYFNVLNNQVAGSKYYYRAFATNGSTVVYGTIKSIQK